MYVIRNGGGDGAVVRVVHAALAARNPSSNYRNLDWSFLHAIPPIGTKFTLPDVLGPQSQLDVLRPTGRAARSPSSCSRADV